MKKTTPVTTPVRKIVEKPDVAAGFPLYWHKRGYWMKKYRGHVLSYERDPDASLERWKADKKAIDERNELAQPKKRYLLRDAINLYLTRQKERHESGELSDVQFLKCRTELQIHLPKAVSINTPLNDFRAFDAGDDRPAILFSRIRAKAGNRGLNIMHRHVVIVRAMFKRAVKKKLMLPPDYGDNFELPKQRQLDHARHELDRTHGERHWSIGELRKILHEANEVGRERKTAHGIKPPRNPHILAQILLGLCAGFGSDDCSAIHESAIDFKTGVHKFPRAKNKQKRMAILPPVVLDAIQWSLKWRKPPADDDARGLLFRTDEGKRCNVAKRDSDGLGLSKLGRNDTIGKAFQRLVKRIGVAKYRTGFKTLRSHFRTMLVGAGIDEDIVRVLMGRPFRYPVDDYYIRGELRAELLKASKHLQKSLAFKRIQTPRPERHASRREPGASERSG